MDVLHKQIKDLTLKRNHFELKSKDLTFDNEALKAQAEEFRKELDYINSFMAENTEYDLFKRIIDWGKRTDLLLLKTPGQCLNSVKISAVNEWFSVYGGECTSETLKEYIKGLT